MEDQPKKDAYDEAMEASLKKLSEPFQLPTFWIVVGYILSALGGMLGVVLGLYLFTAKRSLPDGTTINTFTESQRTHGKIMMFIGCGVMAALALANAFLV